MHVIISFFFLISLQIPTAVVAPGGQPSTAMGRSVASYSGHILKLVPGDYQYSLPEFPIVIIWNWFDTFCPTQFVKAGAITNWKLGIITRHLTEAIDIFEEVEEDIKLANKEELSTAFKNLREETIVTHHLLGDRVAGQSQNIPPVQYGAKKGSATDLTYKIKPGTKFVPMFRHDISTEPALFAPKSTETPVAPDQPKQFPGFHPDEHCQIFTQDFLLPIEIFLAIPSAEARNIPPPQPQQPVFPTPTPVSSRKPGQIAPSATVTSETQETQQKVQESSVPVPPPPPPIQQPAPKPVQQTSSAAPAVPVKSKQTSISTHVRKYNCSFCKYSTDRKNDWENHCNRHTGFTFKCSHPGCKKIFSSDKNRNFHFKNVHLKIKRATCSVESCNVQHNDFGKMKVHEYEVHGIGQECKCKYCDKKFGNWRVLDKHLKICQTEKDKPCPVCKKKYKNTERLISHMDTHHKDSARLICESCGGVYTTEDSLRVHKSTQHK